MVIKIKQQWSCNCPTVFIFNMVYIYGHQAVLSMLFDRSQVLIMETITLVFPHIAVLQAENRK